MRLRASIENMVSSADDVVNSLGFAGGVLVAGALLPQIYLAHKRKSTKDISYLWQVRSDTKYGLKYSNEYRVTTVFKWQLIFLSI